MRSAMKSSHSLFLYISRCSLRLIFLLSVLAFMCVRPIMAQDTAGAESPHPKPTVEEQIRKFIEESVFQSLGIISGVVVSDDYDTGMGFGGNVSQTILDPGLKMKTTVYFWGASRDSNDVSTLGVEETLMLEKSPRPNIDIFSGVTAGYYSKELDTLKTSGETTAATATNSFDIYMTTGFRYRYREGRSFLLYMNYLITQETNEIHFIAGLEFFKPLKQSTSPTVRMARYAR
jgi:hypothetical protein